MRNALTFLLALFFVIQAQTTNTYTVDKTISASYSTMNAYVTAKGSTQISPMFAGGTWKVVGKCTVPSNIDLYGFANGFKFIGNTGSATDTLVISKMYARPMHQIFDSSVTVQFAAGAVDEYNPIWFGAKGDGTTDLYLPLTRCLASMKAYGGKIVFSQGGYRVTQTIEINLKRGVQFIGSMGTVNLNQDDPLDSRIFYDGTDSTKPIFYVGPGQNIEFRNLVFDGVKDSNSTIKAHAGVWADGNHENYRFYGCKFKRCHYGIRICSSYNYYTGVNTPGTNAYTGVYDAAAESVGGHASDNFYTESCSFGWCTIAGISVESSQCLDAISIKCLFSRCKYGYLLTAVQGLEILDPTFLTCLSKDIYLKALNSSGGVMVNGAHTEGDSMILFESDNPSMDMGNNRISHSGGGTVRWSGQSGTLVIEQCYLNKLTVLDDSISLTIENSRVNLYQKSSGNGSSLRIFNTRIDSLSGVSVWGYNTLMLNKVRAGIDSLGFSDIGLVVNSGAASNLPKIMLGNPYVGGDVDNFWGAFIHGGSGNFDLSTDAYKNNAGIWKAVRAPGSIFGFNNGQLYYKPFTGASVGSVPPFRTRFLVDSAGNIDSTKNISTKGIIKTTDTTNSTSTTTGSIVSSGGLGVAKNIWSGAKIQSGDTLRTGNASSYAQLDSVNGLLLAGNATVWDDIRIVPGSTDRPGGSDPTLVAYGATYLWEYEVNDSSTFTIQAPHGYYIGDSVYAHAHWTPGTRGNEEGTATVGWKIGYTWASIDSVFPAFQVVDIFDTCKSTDGQHLMTQEVGRSGAGKGKSSMILGNFKRTDTGTDDTWVGTASGQLPFLLEIDFHIQLNKLGTPTRQ